MQEFFRSSKKLVIFVAVVSFFATAAISTLASRVQETITSQPALLTAAPADLWARVREILRTGTTTPETPQKSASVPLYKPAEDYESAVVSAVKKAAPAVVAITVSKNISVIENCPSQLYQQIPPEFRQFFDIPGLQNCERREIRQEQQEVGGGSGFIVSADGMVVTNKHVVRDEKATYTVFTNDGKKYEARVLARDPLQDLAVLKIEAANLPIVTLADSEGVQLGQTAIAIGNALGEYRNTVSVGVISGLARDITASGSDGFTESISGVIQTDAAINQGNSGGPLLNLRGEVVGINTAVASEGQGIGFAIPINRAKSSIEQVKRTGKIELPYLGVRYVAVTPELAQKEKLSVAYGALVRGNNDGPAVIAGSPAAIAGVQAGDIITEIDGKTLNQENQLVNVISQLAIGQTVELKVNRQGKELTLKAVLAKRP